ncbi:hypothetical protein PanWU01x14_065960 [Parasponia andersonii]|uniref:Transmembrane protein n=1 Tax=Parasponia andersonii TaxID=3476 RepID=A0A2P5DFY8_PARAD|nr:hypothetical protein PanWU01x14_065960 [Parasponia andersonii]
MKAMKISTTAATVTSSRTNGIIGFLLNRNHSLFFPRTNYYHNSLHFHYSPPPPLVLSLSLSLSMYIYIFPSLSLSLRSTTAAIFADLYWVLLSFGKVFLFVVGSVWLPRKRSLGKEGKFKMWEIELQMFFFFPGLFGCRERVVWEKKGKFKMREIERTVILQTG